MAEDNGFEPLQPFGRQFSKLLQYRYANLPNMVALPFLSNYEGGLMCHNMERVARIELALLGWKPRVLPIYDTRK